MGIREIRGWLYRLSWRQSITQFPDGSFQQRVKRVWGDFREGFEHETAFVHGWMRDRQAGIVDDGIAEQKNVEIDDARAFFLRLLPSQLLLDVENAGKKLLRRLLRIQLNRAIQEPGLRGEFHRFGFIE